MSRSLDGHPIAINSILWRYTGGAAWKVYAYDLNKDLTEELFTIENGTPKLLNPSFHRMVNGSLIAEEIIAVYTALGLTGVTWNSYWKMLALWVSNGVTQDG